MAGLLEREVEMRRLGAALATAGGGEGSLVSVEGAAGAGKSALLEAAASDARASGFAVLRATGREIEREFAFGAVTQLFSPLLAALAEPEREELFSGAAELARPLFDGELGSGPVGEAFPRLHGLYWLCVNLSARRPQLLVVDDAHWADEASLAFVSYLAARAQELALCLAVGIRSHETDAGSKLSAVVAGEGGEIVQPAPLSDSAVAQLVRDRLDSDDDRLAGECARLAGGNPLFLRELIRSIDQAGDLDPSAVAAAGPESVARIVEARIRRLSDLDAAVIRAVSVLGDGADAALVARLAELDPSQLAGNIDRLTRVGLLDAARPLSFEHPIVRQTVYESIAPAARSAGHLEAARALAADPQSCERAAGHLLEAEATFEPAGEEAVAALRLAAARARERGGSEQGIRFLGRALEEPLEPDLRRDLLLELGTEELRLGRGESVASLEKAEQLSAPGPELAEAALALSTAQAQTGALAEAVATCDRALGAASEVRELRLALEAQRANASWIAGTLSGEERVRLRGLEGEVAAGESPAERAVLTILAVEAAVTAARGAEKVWDLADRALGGGTLLAELGAEHPTYTFAVAAKTLAGDFGAAVEEWSAGVEDSRGRGSLLGYANALFCRAYSKHLLGDLPGAEADTVEAIELLPESELITAPLPLATAANIAVERGDLPASVERALEQQIAREEIPPVGTVNYAVVASGWLALSRERFELALERFTDTGRRCRLNDWTGPTAMGWRSGAALALVELGRREEALELVSEELELARAFGAGPPLGIALRAKAKVVGGDGGVELCREAVAVLAGSEAALEHAKALIGLGEMLLGAGASDDCREPLREGMDLAHGCGSTAAVERALAELRRAGARPRRPAVRGSDALSPKERQTARLAGEGLGNREIAEAMFLTRRTVEMHLSNSYRKLGISTREELPAALEQVA